MTKHEKAILIERHDRLWAELKEYEFYLALKSDCEDYYDFQKTLGDHKHYNCKLYEWCLMSDILDELGIDPNENWNASNELTRRASTASNATWTHFHR